MSSADKLRDLEREIEKINAKINENKREEERVEREYEEKLRKLDEAKREQAKANVAVELADNKVHIINEERKILTSERDHLLGELNKKNSDRLALSAEVQKESAANK